MLSNTVTCVRCQLVLPAHEADISADGMLCRKCAISTAVAKELGGDADDPHALHNAERDLLRSKYTKHLLIGVGGLVLGVPILLLMLWAATEGEISKGLILGGFLTVAGGAELLRGLSGLSRLGKRKRVRQPMR